MKEIREHFELLGVTPDTSLDDVKEAYVQLLKVWNPVRFEDDPSLQAKTSEKVEEIHQAYAVVVEYIVGNSITDKIIQREAASKQVAVARLERRNEIKKQIIQGAAQEWNKPIWVSAVLMAIIYLIRSMFK